MLPDLQTVVFFQQPLPGALETRPALYSNPALFAPLEAAPPGYIRHSPSFVAMSFPPGTAPGAYRFFCALVRQGALVKNRIAAEDILALDVRILTVSP
jgi:hypothetical protein